MEIKCLYDFKSFSEFSKFTDFIEQRKWNIEKQLLKNRVLKYKNMPEYLMLKKKFLEKKISIFALKEEEIITWFDTSSLMRRVLFDLYKKGINTEGINIIMEYPVIFGNHMRTDYLLVYDRLIVVLEFGMFNQDERRSEERYTKKLQESISYRQIMANMLPKEIKIVNYVMIYKPEYDADIDYRMKDNIIYNNKEIEKLVMFLQHHIATEDIFSAKKQLKIVANFN